MDITGFHFIGHYYAYGIINGGTYIEYLPICELLCKISYLNNFFQFFKIKKRKANNIYFLRILTLTSST